MPSGPPCAWYTGRTLDPTGALFRVNVDAKDGLVRMRAKKVGLSRTGMRSPGTTVLYLPGTHLSQLVLPAVLRWPAWHVVHNEAADALAYVPAGQSAHVFAVPTLQAASNPGMFVLLSDVKTTCRYPVDEWYTLSELTVSPMAMS